VLFCHPWNFVSSISELIQSTIIRIIKFATFLTFQRTGVRSPHIDGYIRLVCRKNAHFSFIK
jgi:hypothetical protein